MRNMLVALMALVVGCADYRLLTREELDRHPPPPERRFPRLSSSVGGRHQNLPDYPSRRRAVTPGLVETDYHYDEQVLVRVATLDFGASVMADASARREDLAVPAGTFEKCVLFSVTA